MAEFRIPNPFARNESGKPEQVNKNMGPLLVPAQTIDELIQAFREIRQSNILPTAEYQQFTQGDHGTVQQFLSTLETIQRMAPNARDPITLTQIKNAVQTLPHTANIQEKVWKEIQNKHLMAVQAIDLRSMSPAKSIADIPAPTRSPEPLSPRLENLQPKAETLPLERSDIGIKRLIGLEERLRAIEENRELLPKEKLLDPDTPFDEVMDILKGMADRQVILVDDKGNAFATKAIYGSINVALSLFRGQEFLSDEDFRHVIRTVNLLPKQFLLRDHVLKEILSWYDVLAANNNLAIDFPPLKPIT